MMEDYVIEAGGISLCTVETGDGCSDREKDFIAKWKDKDSASTASQLTRLQGMKASKMTPDLAQWLKQRIAILKQLSPDSSEL